MEELSSILSESIVFQEVRDISEVTSSTPLVSTSLVSTPLVSTSLVSTSNSLFTDEPLLLISSRSVEYNILLLFNKYTFNLY